MPEMLPPCDPTDKKNVLVVPDEPRSTPLDFCAIYDPPPEEAIEEEVMVGD